MKKLFVCLLMLLNVGVAYANDSIATAHHDFYMQVCSRFIACGDHPHVAEMASIAQIHDVKSCMKAMTSRDNSDQWISLLDKKLISFDSTKKSQCLSAVSELSCGFISGGIQKPAAIKGCEGFINGKLELEASCKTQMECKSLGTVCYGTCQQPPLLACGDELCTSNQRCDSKTLRCILPKKAGESCANFSECETSNCSDGTCGAPPVVSKPGGSCKTGFVCPLGEECDGETCKPY